MTANLLVFSATLVVKRVLYTIYASCIVQKIIQNVFSATLVVKIVLYTIYAGCRGTNLVVQKTIQKFGILLSNQMSYRYFIDKNLVQFSLLKRLPFPVFNTLKFGTF